MSTVVTIPFSSSLKSEMLIFLLILLPLDTLDLPPPKVWVSDRSELLIFKEAKFNIQFLFLSFY